MKARGNEYFDFKFVNLKEYGTCMEHKRLHTGEDDKRSKQITEKFG